MHAFTTLWKTEDTLMYVPPARTIADGVCTFDILPSSLSSDWVLLREMNIITRVTAENPQVTVEEKKQLLMYFLLRSGHIPVDAIDDFQAFFQNENFLRIEGNRQTRERLIEEGYLGRGTKLDPDYKNAFVPLGMNPHYTVPYYVAYLQTTKPDTWQEVMKKTEPQYITLANEIVSQLNGMPSEEKTPACLESITQQLNQNLQIL